MTVVVISEYQSAIANMSQFSVVLQNKQRVYSDTVLNRNCKFSHAQRADTLLFISKMPGDDDFCFLVKNVQIRDTVGEALHR